MKDQLPTSPRPNKIDIEKSNNTNNTNNPFGTNSEKSNNPFGNSPDTQRDGNF